MPPCPRPVFPMSSRPKILLVNPPIHDFSAYDFWLKPYGLLQAAGFLRRRADLHLFDFLDRHHPLRSPHSNGRNDLWGRGAFDEEIISKPEIFSAIPRHYHRFGLPRETFQNDLAQKGPFDFILVQTMMTYWYQGVKEVSEDVRRFSPGAQIILGGPYATLCPQHARCLGVDHVIRGADLTPLWNAVGCQPDPEELPYWEGYASLETGVLKLGDGCPFQCTYCCVPQVYGAYRPRLRERALEEFLFLCRRGVRNIAFYDDALLFRSDEVLIPFLKDVMAQQRDVCLHLPNAIHVRFLTREAARWMVAAGFKTFYLGFESASRSWQKKTGGKVHSEELIRAVENLICAGADMSFVTVYLILGHPQDDGQQLEESMLFAHKLGLRIMLSDYSPIPGTPDGERCRQWVNMDEPLWHNKTAFPIRLLGYAEVDRLKNLCRQLNQELAGKVLGPVISSQGIN